MLCPVPSNQHNLAHHASIISACSAFNSDLSSSVVSSTMSGWTRAGFYAGFSYYNSVSAIYFLSTSTSARYPLSSTPSYGTYSWVDTAWTSLQRHVQSFMVGRSFILVIFPPGAIKSCLLRLLCWWCSCHYWDVLLLLIGVVYYAFCVDLTFDGSLSWIYCLCSR